MSEVAAASHAVELNPVRGRDRIAVLDMMRGIAILGIFVMNVPLMAGPINGAFGDWRAMGWSPADQHAWLFVQTFWEGTQRGMLEMLFGAGLMVTAAKAMEPDGPVAVADLYIRRNLWLLAFGLLDIFGLLWAGDILHVYALCALALFPFRRMKVKWLLTIGLVFSTVQLVGGAFQYHSRGADLQTYAVAQEKQHQGKVLTEKEQDVVKEMQKREKMLAGKDPEMTKMVADEAKARSGSFLDYASYQIKLYIEIVSRGALLFGVIEAFGTMLIGIALWKLGFIQGRRESRDYWIVLVVAYGFGLTARYVGGLELMAFNFEPKTFWMTNELSRLAVSLGHIAAVNLLVRGIAGRKLLHPFIAAGQMAFSLYFMEQFIGIFVLYSPIGMHLPGAQGWAYLGEQALAVMALLLVVANVWMRFFVSGPLEWVWRSLAYNRRQPFRRV